MAVAQDASGSPHPWVTGDFVRKSRIIYGAEAVSPYRKGVQDLAYNANTLMARLRKPLATDAQDSTATLTLTTAFQTFGWYVIKTQNYSGRTTMRTQMRVGTTSGGTYEVKASFIPVSGGTLTATYNGTTANGWISWDTTGLALNTVYIVKLEARYTVAGASWNPQAVYIDQIANTSGSLASMSWVLEGVHPLDITQYQEDAALSVAMARECIHNNNVLWANQTNPLVTCASWHIHTTGTTSTVATGLQTWYQGLTFGGISVSGRVGLIKEWVYWPRPGVTSLDVYLNGFVTGWASGTDTASLALQVKGYDPGRLAFSIASATANYAVGSWNTFGGSLTLPQDGSGPLYIQLMGGHGTNNRPAYIQSLNLLEHAPSIPTYA